VFGTSVSLVRVLCCCNSSCHTHSNSPCLQSHMSVKKSRWEPEVQIAKEGVDTGLPALRWGQCSCKENELLMRFLMYDASPLPCLSLSHEVPCFVSYIIEQGATWLWKQHVEYTICVQPNTTRLGRAWSSNEYLSCRLHLLHDFRIESAQVGTQYTAGCDAARTRT
jgi:hypothetical protein